MNRRPDNGFLVFLLVIPVALSTHAARADVFHMGPGLTSLEFVPVGNPGNAPDSAVMLGDGTTGYGSAGYPYRIGKHEVTNGQYAEFLNAVDPTGTKSAALYSPFMTDHPAGRHATGGIDYASGAPNGAKYSVKAGRGNMPVVWVSWYDAARFVNWLSNGQGSGSAETGVYDMTQAFPARTALANVFIPTEDEWYKAAYYQPAGAGGDSDSFWLYPTRTNTEPNSDQPPGDPSIQSNVANFLRDDGLQNGYNDGYAVTGSPTFDGQQNYLTDVGAYLNAPSFYGTLDQGGNVYEWNESIYQPADGLLKRVVRGGAWNSTSASLRAIDRSYEVPSYEGFYFGFRVASIPEPSTAALGVLGILFGWVSFVSFRGWREC